LGRQDQIVANAKHDLKLNPLESSFWTIIVLAPETWNDTTHGIEGGRIRDDENAPDFEDVMARVVLESIRKLYDR
jgi:hypothetical protein